MSDQIDRLGRQLDAIKDALVVASEERDPEERERLLAVVERAHGAAREEYEAVRRSRFRLLKGGLSIAGVTAIAAHAREHPAALASVSVATVAAAVLGTVVALGPSGEPPSSAGRPPSAITAPPSMSRPPPTAGRTPAPGKTSTAPPPVSSSPARIPPQLAAGPPPSAVAVVPAGSVSAAPTTATTTAPPSPPGTTPPATEPPTTGPPATGPPITVTPPPATPPPATPPGHLPSSSGLCLPVQLPPLLDVDVCLLGS